MSNEEIVFNGKGFVENIDSYVLTSEIADHTNLTAKTVLNAQQGGVDAFLQTYNTTNKRFASWDSFLESAVGSDQAKKDAILEGFVDSYRDILNMGSGDSSDPPTGSEWDGLVTALANLSPPQTIDVKQEFINSFESFLYTYPYKADDPNTDPADESAVTDADEFFLNWVKFMGVTAQIDDSTDGQARNVSTVDVNAYEQIYVAFGFDLSLFHEKLAEFYVKQTDLSQGGNPYFIPSHQFDEWFETLREDYIHVNYISSVDTNTKSELLVIDRILRLLVSIIDVLQRTSAVQANRLGFLTDWQRAYTDQLNEIPQFAEGDDTPIGTTTTTAKNKRSELNARMQAITEKVRARRSTVQDTAKALQSSINSSQDAANQQTQMATSLLQQLSTILSQIFR